MTTPSAVRVSGLTIAKQAVEFQYPLVQSLRSLLPLVDELVINIGDSDDGTWEVVQALDDPKIVAFRSTWDPAKRDGLTLSEETNKALARCTGTWAIYLQADEVLHEADHPLIRSALDRYWHTGVEAMSLLYYHFYGSYQTFQDDPRHWYRRATRIVRTGVGIESVGDACAFMRRSETRWRTPRRKALNAHVYHYGRTRPPAVMLQKQRAFERYYYDQAWLDTQGLRADTNPASLYSNDRHLRVFTGTHPAVMAPLIAAAPPAAVRTGSGPIEWVRRTYVYSAWVVGWILKRLADQARRAFGAAGQ